MNRKAGALFATGLIAAGVVAGAGRVYRARPRQRIPGHEALDDPAVGAAFGRIAAWPQMKLLRSLVVRRATSLASAGEALDVGCGPGHLVVALAQRAPGLRVTGLDLADALLAAGEANARVHGVAERVSFRHGDATAIPCADASLDLVVSTLSLHHWRDPVAVFNEVARVLRPGGAFVIFDLRRDIPPPAYMLLWFATNLVVPKPLRQVGEPLASRHASYTPDEVSALAARSRLDGWRVDGGPLWLFLSGRVLPQGR